MGRPVLTNLFLSIRGGMRLGGIRNVCLWEDRHADDGRVSGIGVKVWDEGEVDCRGVIYGLESA